jgi:hypothetical protein
VFVRGTDNGIWHLAATLPGTECPTSALNVTLQNGQGAAGSLFWDLTFTNASGTACFIQGFPGVSWVNAAGGQIGVAATRDSSLGNFGPVPLPPGGSAAALLRLVQAGLFDPARCGPVPAAGIRVFPPDQLIPKIVANQQLVCSNTGLTTWSSVTVVFSLSLSMLA